MVLNINHPMKEYIHRQPGEEAQILPWSFTLVEEGRMPCGGRDVLYVVGDALVGSSCVGVGTLRYIHVPGYVAQWHHRLDADCNPVSAVDPVTDEEDRAAIQEMLSSLFPGLQVCF